MVYRAPPSYGKESVVGFVVKGDHPPFDPNSRMTRHRKRTIFAQLALALGAVAVLAAGADHLYEYWVNGFSTVPTIGTLFLLNFISATLVGIGLLLPLRRLVPRHAASLRALLAVGGIGIGAASLIGLWISETSSLFGFTDSGFRPTILAAVVSESVAVVALGAYLVLADLHVPRRLAPHPS